MTFQVKYDSKADTLTLTRGKVQPYFVKRWYPGQNHVVSKATFRIIGLQLTGFLRNWTDGNRVCQTFADHFAVEPGEIHQVLLSLNTNQSG